jgi:hypothetical protein
MKIVIDIPEEVKDNFVKRGFDKGVVAQIIENGIILPNEHGRLIDADELLEKQYCIDDSATLSTRDVVDVEDVDDAPTIIEADKEVKE